MSNCRSKSQTLRWQKWRRKRGIPEDQGERNRLYHQRYVEKNRDRVRQYNREWYQRNWGESNQKRGKEAEKFAKALLLKLGFENLTHLSDLHGFILFDYYAERLGKKCLIDVTTAMWKEVKVSRFFSMLFGIPYYTLFVKPDFSKFCLKEVALHQKNIRVKKGELKNV